MKIVLEAPLDSPTGFALGVCIERKRRSVDNQLRMGKAQNSAGLWTQYWRLDEVLRDIAENTEMNKRVKYYVDKEDSSYGTL
jgi:hypothetical protein